MHKSPITGSPPQTVATVDRPGWIPDHIEAGWDPSPYAYQTEEERMPAGGLHGHILAYILEVVRHIIEARGWMFLVDTFLLYRDATGVKRRIGPDLILMPYRFPPPAAYDLDVEPPPPLVVEVTSPDSHRKDLESNVDFYRGLGVSAYLVIDAITPGGEPRPQIELHLWHLEAEQPRQVAADADGGFSLLEVGLRVLAQGQQLLFVDAVSGEVLRDMGAERRARQEAETRADEERRVRQELEARLRC